MTEAERVDRYGIPRDEDLWISREKNWNRPAGVIVETMKSRHFRGFGREAAQR